MQLETSLRQVGAQGRETVKVGPFEAFISASKNPVMSFATPYTEVPELVRRGGKALKRTVLRTGA